MFCTNCGHEITSDARFCAQCGQGTGFETAPAGDRGYYAPRRLYRLTYDKQIGGVCAGIAKYLDLDVTLIRVLVVAAAICTGVLPGVLAYFLAMIIMPKDSGVMRPAPMTTTVTNV
jgi:phage shock protein C